MRCALSGCGAVAEPSGVMKKPVLSSSSGFGTVGVETKSETVTTNGWPLRIGRLGVTTSSSPARVQSATRPFTRTAPTLSPAKSRLKLESDWVARARIRAVPSIGCAGSLVA
jgi:hypothetical protein